MAEPFLGEIRMLGSDFPPRGWAACNGQLLPINQNQGLFSLLGTTYGGDGRVNFALPNLQGRSTRHMSDDNPLGAVKTVGTGQAGEDQPGYLTINFCIATQGIFPSPN